MKNRLMLLSLLVVVAVMAGVCSDHRCFPGSLHVQKRVCVGEDASFGHKSKCPLHVLRAQEQLQVLAGVLRFPQNPGITYSPDQSNGPVIQGTLAIANPCMRLVRGCSLSTGPIRGDDRGQVELRIPVKFDRSFSRPPTVLAGLETCEKTLFVTEREGQDDEVAFLGALFTTVEDVRCDGFTLVMTVAIGSTDSSGGLTSDLLNKLLPSLFFDIAAYGPVSAVHSWSGQCPKRPDDLFVHSLTVKKDLCIGDWLQFGCGLGSCAIATDWPTMQNMKGTITIDSIAELSLAGSETASDILLDIRGNATLAIDGICKSVSLQGSIRQIANMSAFYVDIQVPIDFPRTFACSPLAEITIGSYGYTVIAQRQSTAALVVSVVPMWTAPTRGSGNVRMLFIVSASDISSVLAEVKQLLETSNLDFQLIGVPFACHSRSELLKSESKNMKMQDRTAPNASSYCAEPDWDIHSADKSKTLCIDGSLCVARDLCVGGVVRFPCHLTAVGSSNPGGALTRGIVALPKQLEVKISSDYSTVTVDNDKLCLVSGAGLEPGKLEIRSRYFVNNNALYVTVFVPVDRCPGVASVSKAKQLIVNTQIARCTPWAYMREDQGAAVFLISAYTEVINRVSCALGTPAVTFVLAAQPDQPALVEQFLEELVAGMQLHLAVLSGG